VKSVRETGKEDKLEEKGDKECERKGIKLNFFEFKESDNRHNKGENPEKAGFKKSLEIFILDNLFFMSLFFGEMTI